VIKSLSAIAFGVAAGILAAALVTGRGPFRRAEESAPPALPPVVPAPVPAPAAPPQAPRETFTADRLKIAELMRANEGLPADPALSQQYREINTRYFNGALAPVSVRWEPRLAEVGPLIADGFRLEGATDAAQLILVNPAIRSDEATLRRVLVHEMVHVAVRVHGDDHGPVFQTYLRQLSEKGAFEGVVASDEEKASLRASLDAQSAALETEAAGLDKTRKEIQSARPTLPIAVSELNAQIADYNARVQRHNDAIAAFNRGVERYNLMIVYPDGLDRQRYERRPSLAQPAK
jgi:hypothetical protein